MQKAFSSAGTIRGLVRCPKCKTGIMFLDAIEDEFSCFQCGNRLNKCGQFEVVRLSRSRITGQYKIPGVEWGKSKRESPKVVIR